MTSGLIWVDYVILAIVGLSVLISLWRGFLSEVVSLITWAAAFVLAFLFMGTVAALFEPYVDLPSVRIVLAFGSIFVVTLFVGGLVNIIVSLALRKTGLSVTDRLLGMFFGIARGIALVAILVLLAGLTPLPQDPWWKASQFIPRFEGLAAWMKEQLPPEYAERFQFTLPLVAPALAVGTQDSQGTGTPAAASQPVTQMNPPAPAAELPVLELTAPSTLPSVDAQDSTEPTRNAQ